MTRDKRYYENRLNLLMAREKDNKRICNKIRRKIKLLEKA